ncbi:MAG: chromosome partitioning protein ParB [Pyrinomonadaceae bacterium]
MWQLAENLPVKFVPIENIAELDRDCWFDDEKPPTCRTVAAHAKRIYEADLSFPIILSAEGYLMDGGHRIAKAWLLGLKEIQAVQFEINPQPDEIRPEEK